MAKYPKQLYPKSCNACLTLNDIKTYNGRSKSSSSGHLSLRINQNYLNGYRCVVSIRTRRNCPCSICLIKTQCLYEKNRCEIFMKAAKYTYSFIKAKLR